MPPGPPDGAYTAPVPAGEGTELTALCPACRASVDPATAQPVPRTAATAVTATVAIPARRCCPPAGLTCPMLLMSRRRASQANVAHFVYIIAESDQSC